MAPKRSERHSAARRNEILDVAQRLVATKGYQQMTIEDILAELGISKGAFYHYFDSKADLLESLVARMREEASQILLPVLEDPHLSAVEKLQRWFDVAGRWKTARREYLLSLLHVWYHDDNAVVRQKLRADNLAWISPLLTGVVRQGIAEGAFASAYPDHVGHVVFSLINELGDSLALQILSGRADEQGFAEAQASVAAFTDAIERALGAQPASLFLVDPEMLREWFGEPVPVA
jgi:AcrR family transcriptional regulator